VNTKKSLPEENATKENPDGKAEKKETTE